MRPRQSILLLGTVTLTFFVGFGVNAAVRARGKLPFFGGSGTRQESLPTAGVRKLLRLPLIDQGQDFTCGVAALQSVLFYFDMANDYLESELVDELDVDPDAGVMVRSMTSFARSLGYHAEYRKNMSLAELKEHIDRGIPVIVILQAWPDEPPEDWRKVVDEGHYAVVIGYDDRNIYFMDPSMTSSYAFIPRSEFLDRWHHEDDEFGQGELVEHLGIVIYKDSEPQYREGLAWRMY